MYVYVCAHMYAGDRELWVCVFAIIWDRTEYKQISVVESNFLVEPDMAETGRWCDWIPERYK